MRTVFVLALLLGLGSTAALATSTAPPAKSTAMPSCATGDPVVWVNTSSHVYHMQGSKYYGNTKAGKYACKSAADSSGAHLAKNESTAPKSSTKATPAPSSSPASSKHHKSKATPSPEATST